MCNYHVQYFVYEPLPIRRKHYSADHWHKRGNGEPGLVPISKWMHKYGYELQGQKLKQPIALIIQLPKRIT